MPVELVRLQNMTTLNTGDPLAPLRRKEINISFPEANVQTLRLGCNGSASFVWAVTICFLYGMLSAIHRGHSQ